MTGFLKNFLDNPILTRELRRRMRGKALVYSIIGYIILMTLISILILIVRMDPFTLAEADTQQMLEKLSATGKFLFISITLLQGMLVLIIAPTITAGMTTGEKEKKTFDFLRVTTITPWMYIMGCFLSTVFYVSLALICALPLISLAFLYGGIGSQDVVRMGGILLGMSMVLSAFGLLISSLRERTRTAQGIVVFMIFSLIFGGSLLFRQIDAWLGLSGGGAGGSSSTGITLFAYTVPNWIIVAAGMLAITSVFLLVATRKLFDPDETRALSHWQFAFFAAGIMAVLVGTQAGGPLSNEGALLFLASGSVLLLVAVGTFAVGRMEVGDEIWHMKRLLPFLRPIDQTVPYLALVGVCWFLAVDVWTESVLSITPNLQGTINAVLMISLVSFAFFVLFARYATAIAVGRKGAGRWVIAMMAFCWILLPAFSAIVMAVFEPEDSLIQWFFNSIARFSPFFAMVEGINDKSPFYSQSAEVIAQNYMVPLAVYVAAAVVFLCVGEYKRFKRWRRFDYHYDMPAA